MQSVYKSSLKFICNKRRNLRLLYVCGIKIALKLQMCPKRLVFRFVF